MNAWNMRFLLGVVLLVVLSPAWAADYPVAPTDDDVEVTYRLTDAEGMPGEKGVPVYFFMDTNSAMNAFRMALTYDSDVLAAESIETFIEVGGGPPGFLITEIYPYEGPDAPHGCLIAMVSDLTQEIWYYPEPGEPTACIYFTVLPEAEPGSEAAVIFADRLVGTPPIPNDVFCHELLPIEPGVESSGVQIQEFVAGNVKVVGEVMILLRGDANSDRTVDIADAVSILSYLFASGAAPLCPDAADANDDGQIDVADPIAVLWTLFASGDRIAEPYPAAGKDPTPDALGPCYN
jgi:hypothetical protein